MPPFWKGRTDMDISGRTKTCGIIGDPVEHTMSPAMHNAAFKKLELDFVYLPWVVKPEGLKKAVAGLRALGVTGFNVTIPHKVAVLPLLDSLDPLAQKIGAVNTVVNIDGQLRGFNTDAEGFYQALVEHGIKPVGQKAVVLGVGGASRAVSYILARMGMVLTIVCRPGGLTRALDIASMVKADFSTEVTVTDDGKMADALPGAVLLINTTSVGMSPYITASPVPAALLEGIPTVFDIVYNPMQTQLLKDAKKAGAKTIGGVDMLAWQGALAFEKWTGRKAPLELMRHEVVKMLEKHEI
jgi:shikimate dehydrogenase